MQLFALTIGPATGALFVCLILLLDGGFSDVIHIGRSVGLVAASVSAPFLAMVILFTQIPPSVSARSRGMSSECTLPCTCTHTSFDALLRASDTHAARVGMQDDACVPGLVDYRPHCCVGLVVSCATTVPPMRPGAHSRRCGPQRTSLHYVPCRVRGLCLLPLPTPISLARFAGGCLLLALL